jgi:hypothetical protein
MPIRYQHDYCPAGRSRGCRLGNLRQPIDRLGGDPRQIGRKHQQCGRFGAGRVASLREPFVQPVAQLQEGRRSHRPCLRQQLGIEGDHGDPVQASGGHGCFDRPPEHGKDQVGPFLGVERLTQARLGSAQRADGHYRDDSREIGSAHA